MQLNKELINTGQQCPYCGKQTKLVPSTYIYGAASADYGWFYVCDKDQAYVGCHKGTNKALGRLANKELRALKINAHKAFDKLWNKSNVNKITRRSNAYKWLSTVLNIPIEETHIGMFTEEQCKKVCMICSDPKDFNEYLKKQI